MKQLTIDIFLAVLLMATLIACHDHDDFLVQHHQNINVQFDSTRLVIRENEQLQTIKLVFSKPVSSQGTVTLLVSNPGQSRFTIEPGIADGLIKINLMKNQESATITLRPLNNSQVDGNLDFTLTILGASTGLTPGDRRSVTLTLLDDDLAAPTPSIANFSTTEKDLIENNELGKAYTIKLSEALTSAGSIELLFESSQARYGTHFTTVPASFNSKFILHPTIGDKLVSFVVLPINNSIINGEMEITFTIVGTTGSITKGSSLRQDVIVLDDELTDKPKGYRTSDGNWGLLKTYEYDELGRIKYVDIKSSTPATSMRKEAYFYDMAGRIQRINKYPQTDLVFTWSNERITKSESIDRGIVKEYTDYEYDAAGNVSGAANYFRQPDGQFKLGFLNTYLYFHDGNLHKSQTYIPSAESQELTLLSTRTYDNYADAENPFPMVEILPNIKTQTKLPTTYRIEEHGLTLNYRLKYEFRDDGRVSMRLATTGSRTETCIYLYY